MTSDPANVRSAPVNVVVVEVKTVLECRGGVQHISDLSVYDPFGCPGRAAGEENEWAKESETLSYTTEDGSNVLLDFGKESPGKTIGQ